PAARARGRVRLSLHQARGHRLADEDRGQEERMRIAVAAALAAALVTPQAFAQVVNESSISADAALEIAAAALAQCRKDGQKVSVTVVDAAGRPKAMVRDDGAAPHTAEHSFRKAYTALSYKT